MPDIVLTGPSSGLPIGIDPVVPIVIGLVVGLVFLAVLARVAVGRSRLSAREPSEVAQSNTGPQPLGETAGRDLNLPRWLDPSVTAARFKTDATTKARPADAVAITAARAPMVFVATGEEVAERRRVRYDGVPLLDRPDDVLGRMLRELDGGDEVEVLERAEIWAQVRTPSDLIGWIPGMTLSDVSTAAAEDVPDNSDAIEVDLSATVDEEPAFEVLLAAIAAQRLARPEPEPLVEATPTLPRPRARKPKGDQQPPRTRRPRQGSKAARADET
jgi:hypothetical protein